MPVVPDLNANINRMWRAYGGFTWALAPYTAVNFTTYVDTPEMKLLQFTIDPITYFARIRDLPKFIVVAADDEFMMPDWTNIWYDRLGGEKHLLIQPNEVHGLSFHMNDIMTSINTFYLSVAMGIKSRP